MQVGCHVKNLVTDL